jgi:hypothetical protein
MISVETPLKLVAIAEVRAVVNNVVGAVVAAATASPEDPVTA